MHEAKTNTRDYLIAVGLIPTIVLIAVIFLIIKCELNFHAYEKMHVWDVKFLIRTKKTLIKMDLCAHEDFDMWDEINSCKWCDNLRPISAESTSK